MQLTLIAEGHYPADEALFVPLSVQDEPQTLPPFPGDTLAYRVEARGGTFDGAGRVSVHPDQTRDVLVLPLGRMCTAAQRPRGRFERGSAAALGDAELLWVGQGEDSTRITPSRGEITAPREPLFVPRVGATVTPFEDGALVVGGRQLDAADAPALGNYERFDPDLDGFDEVGRLEVARADHAAVRAADGSLWVAGGRDGPRLLDSLERVGVGTLDATLARPSASLSLLALDDGSVVALDFDRSAAPSVQHFDAAGRVGTQAADLPVETAPELVVALPGARLLAFEVDTEGRTTGRACLRFGVEGDACLDGWLTPFAGLTAARAVALRDGRALVVGERDGEASLRLVDVGRLVVEARRAPFVPLWAGLLGDGSVALVGEREVAVLREDTLSATRELPATLLAPDAPLLALDSVERWRWQGLSLVAESDRAEAYLAAVRLLDVAIEVEVEDELDIVFGWNGSENRTVRLRPDDIDLFGATLAREPGTVRIERHGDTWEVHSGDGRALRRLPGFVAPARLSLRAAEAGTRITRFTVERL